MRNRTLIQAVPPMAPVERNLSDMRVVLADGYHVSSWSPGKVGTNTPSTEVHLRLPFAYGEAHAQVTIRLKSTRALDELVAVLLQHRTDVWGSK